MPNQMTIQLEPLDTLFFKDGKPFSLGEETWADGIFPPPPSVIYGALRTKYLSANSQITVDNVHIETDKLEIDQIYYKLLKDDEALSRHRLSPSNYLPLPADLVEKDPKVEQGDLSDIDYNELLNAKRKSEETRKSYEVYRLSVKHLDEKIIASSEHNQVYPFWQYDNSAVESIKNGFINANELWEYLAEPKTEKFNAKKLNDYLKTEAKTGIKRNPFTRSASDEGELYRVGMRRAAGFQMEVSFKPISKFIFFRPGEEYCTIKFGAEGKMAKVRLSQTNLLQPVKGIQTALFRLYLATPAIILSDSSPNAAVFPDLSFLGSKVTYLGAAMKKTYSLGGFDMKERRPKPMYKVIPAGSVFYFRADKELHFDQFQGAKVSDIGQKEGFGIAYFGKLNFES